MKFTKVPIKSKEEVAQNTFMVILDVSGMDINFQAGQFIFVRLPEPNYEDEKGPQRYFSIVNSPTEEGVIKFVTRMRDSAFKQNLRELPEGSEVEIGSITGNFVLPEDTKQSLCFIAGGIGITPFKSMLSYIDDNDLEYDVVLLYSNRAPEETAFLEELKTMGNEKDNIKVVFTMTQDENWDGETRRIDSEFVKDNVPDYEDRLFYVAGPPNMVNAMQGELLDLGIDDESMLIEGFGGY